MAIKSLHHIQLAMPKGKENAAVAFYQDLLGLPQVEKPPVLATRGGVWFERGSVCVHLGVEQDFKATKKAHPAFEVAGLESLFNKLQAAGIAINRDENLPGYNRGYVEDPFGNRIELLELKT